MTDLIFIYITCKDVSQAQSIGKHLLEKRLVACINVYPTMHSLYFWPPKSGELESGEEATLIVKTLDSKYDALEAEVKKIHSYQNPCILSLPITHVSKEYYDWLVNEII